MLVLLMVPRFDDKLGSFRRKVIEKSKRIMFFSKSDINKQTNKKTAGMLATEVRTGDAPKPQFSMKTGAKLKKSGNQPQINHRNLSLFLSLLNSSRPTSWTSSTLAKPRRSIQSVVSNPLQLIRCCFDFVLGIE